jgi:hypothetical protein
LKFLPRVLATGGGFLLLLLEVPSLEIAIAASMISNVLCIDHCLLSLLVAPGKESDKDGSTVEVGKSYGVVLLIEDEIPS